MLSNLIEQISKVLDLTLKHNSLFKGINFVNTCSLDKSISKGGIIGCITGIYKDALAQGYSYETVDKNFRIKKNPIYFNVDMAFISAFQDDFFLDGLTILCAIAGAFNSKSIIEIDSNKELNYAAHGHKISIKVQDYTKEQLDNIWNRLGVNYTPAIFCNFASIIITDDSLGQVVPRIEKYHYETEARS